MNKQIFWIAVKAMILNQDNKILILFKSDDEDVNPNDFDLPWWRINRWEDLKNALKRECKEEIGIDVEIINPSNTWWFTKNELHLVGITFIVKYIWWEIVLSHEHSKYFWKTKQEILDWNFPTRLKQEIQYLDI